MSAVEFDPFSSTFFDDPYEMYRRLRDEAPVYYQRDLRLLRPLAR